MTGLTVTPPTKTVYAAGEELDTTGMKVEAKYSDNTTKELTEEEYMLSGFDSSKAGTITVTISVGELKETFDIVIKDKIIGGSDTDNNNEGLGGIQQGAGQIVFGVNQTADTNVKVPKTGDETNAVPALIVLAVSASVAVGTLAGGRRRQRR